MMITDYYKASVVEIFGMPRVNGDVAVEIEIEGRHLPLRIPGWNAVRDGSLRGESMEYVTQGPSSLDGLAQRLAILKKTFSDTGTMVKDAYRGSVHVHVNIQNKTIEQVFTTLYLWLLLEPIFLRLCGPQREGNLFCLPSYAAGDMQFYGRELLSALRNRAFFDIRDRGKYASLNTDCLKTFGSLEFRTFPTTSDTARILKWATWCSKLVAMGSDIDINKIDEVWKEALSEPRKFCSYVFDVPTMAQFSDSDLFDFMETGVESSSTLLLEAHEHLRSKK
jgi:hypothetical protein